MRAIHVVADLGIKRLRHEQIQREAVQQAFDRTFPGARLRAHLEELAGERQIFGIDAERFCQRRPDANVIGGGIVRTAFPRGGFVPQRPVALASALSLNPPLALPPIYLLLVHLYFPPPRPPARLRAVWGALSDLWPAPQHGAHD